MNKPTEKEINQLMVSMIVDNTMQEFMEGVLEAISYEKDTEKSENKIYNKGYDFLTEIKEQLYSRNGNKIYNS